MPRRISAWASVSLCAFLVSGVALAGGGASPKKPVFVPQHAAEFGSTPALRSLPPELLAPPAAEEPPLVINRANEKRVKLVQPGAGAGSGTFRDPLLDRQPLRPDAMPTPTLTFDGMGVSGSAPPDTVMDVGPGHVVELVNNTRIQIFDKAGATLFGPVSLRALFAGLPVANPCRAGTNDGDPIVLYDSLADRWLVSQFEVSAFPNHQCIAISQTGDPLGAYFAYDFVMPAAPAVPETKFQDYPHYGVWPDGYYLTTNQFNQALTAFRGAGVFAFDRLKMLAGDASASYVYVDIEPLDASAGGLLPADLDGYLPPPAGLSNLIMEFRADEFGDPADAIRLYEFVPDFASPASSTLTVHPDVPLAAFDARQPSGRADIEQMGGDNLDSIPDRLMFRLAYRNLGTAAAAANSWVGNFGVNVSGVDPTTAGNYQTGIRWFELHSAAAALPGLFDEGTHNLAPGNGAGGLNNWMGSIAQDNDGNLALGFSQSGSSQRADIKIAGRTGAAAAGTLNEGESLFHAATGSQMGTANRWGDYSSMSVDPADDCTFWYAQEYYASTGSFLWSTRIGSFLYPGCTPAPKGTLQGQVTYCSSGLPLGGAVVSVDGGYFRATDASGNYSMTLAPGSYTVTITKAGFTVFSGPAVVADGGTTDVDACLTGVPIIAAAGGTLVAEGCLPANGVIDPGETVTVNLCVRNIGGADTADLIATLQESGGAEDTSEPVNFGVVVAGGPDVCRDFTFTSDEGVACGAPLTATLELEDGAADLGTAVSTFPTGIQVQAFSENFDGVTPPALPAGWTASGIGNLWVTSATSPDTAPNDAFTDDPAVVSDKSLEWPSIVIGSAAAQVMFRNFYDLEANYDGGVLEISVNGGPYQDILIAGGSFVSGGYNATVDLDYMNPLAGRQAWSGNSGGYVTSAVNLPAAVQGQNVFLRWRMGSDNSISDAGWRIDTILLTDGYICCTPIPSELAVDSTASGSSNTNGVWEPGETVVVEPRYFNGDTSALVLSGTASNLTGPAVATYSLTDSVASYGSIASGAEASCTAGSDCYAVMVDDPARPVQHWDATFDESLSNGAAKTWALHIGESFSDVPTSNIFYSFIETIFHNGVTGGCGGTGYCPGNPALRKQMAVFLLKARYGAAYVPPPAVGIFADVPQPDLFAPWIEDLYSRGITGGCSAVPLNYCPDNTVLRQQMAVFLLKTLDGSAYTPPVCAGIFGDVACPSTFANWIEELSNRAITVGCGGGNFCPAAPNTRGQMAVFLTKTFELLLYAP